MKDNTVCIIINKILFIMFIYIHLFYVSPWLKVFSKGVLGGWGLFGLLMIVAGVWGNIAEVVFIKTFDKPENYKSINNWITSIGGVLFIVDILSSGL